MVKTQTATGMSKDSAFAALTHLQGCRDTEAAAKRDTAAAVLVAFDAVQALGYQPSPDSDAGKRVNKGIVRAFKDDTGFGFSASVRDFRSKDRDNFTDYHRDIEKRWKACPSIVTTEAVRIVKVLT